MIITSIFPHSCSLMILFHLLLFMKWCIFVERLLRRFLVYLIYSTSDFVAMFLITYDGLEQVGEVGSK